MSYTDDRGNEESLTSEPTGRIGDPGICDRTPAVMAAIVAGMTGGGDCSEVSETRLRAWTGFHRFGSGVTPGLHLQGRGLSALQAGDFRGLHALRALDLNRNFLETVPDRLFEDLRTVEEIYLSGNLLNELPDGTFDGQAAYLSVLDLSVNGLETLPEGVLRNLAALVSLSLAGNGLSDLPAGPFDDLARLEVLDLSANSMDELPDGVFDGSLELRDLDLSTNEISELPEGVFGGLGDLQSLSLAGNDLKSLPEDVFADLGNLAGLDLSGNKLKDLPVDVFEGLSGLTDLDAGGNPGAPFTFTAELERRGDDTVVVRLAEGATPFDLLDTRVFADRDRTADSVVRVARGLWEQWGPRMQSILEQTVKTLHEANEQVEAEAQYTILDGLKLLSDDPFRKDVLKKVSDPYLLEWWARDFGRWHAQYKAEALAPVQTRLSYYASSKRARAILGQRRSTIDLRKTIHDGGVLLVSTSQGTVGRDVAALVGTSLLNLADAVAREQGSLPLHRRRGALVVVDEMQSMPGVDYESMLSELGKFGASFVLATQSLAKLDDLSRTMRDTLLANVGCLAVFQVAGNDARTLVWELGKERVTEDDITSLPVHHCYVRATVGVERMPAFSMMVRKPEEGDPAVAARIREAATAYTVSARQADYANADGHKKVGDYRKGLEDLENARQEGRPEAEPDPERRKQTSKRRPNAAGAGGDGAGEAADEEEEAVE